MLENGKTLSMHGDAIYKGTYTHNGTLLKIHENAYTIGYSALLTPDGTDSASVKFGNGVFLDAAQDNNKAYAGAPTVSGASPVFGGIVVREPAIASGYPVLNDEIASFQKGMLVKNGYVIYKNGLAGSASEAAKLFGTVHLGWLMYAGATDGVVYFVAAATAKKSSDDVLVGKVVEVNPDDESVTVHVSEVYQSI